MVYKKESHRYRFLICSLFLLSLLFTCCSHVFANQLIVNEGFDGNLLHYFWSPTVGDQGYWKVEQEEVVGATTLDVINYPHPSTYHLLTGISDNYVLEVDLRNIKGVDKCIRFNDDRTNSFYRVNLRSEFDVGNGPDGNDVNLQKYIGGQYPLLIQEEYVNTPDEWYTIRIQVLDQSISVFVDNVELINYTDPNFLTGTNIALEVWPGGYDTSTANNETIVSFDNIKLYRIDLKPLIIIPGMTASGSWSMFDKWDAVPEHWDWFPFAKSNTYSNLYHSLNINGFEEDSDYYTFHYNWLRPLTENVERLDEFVDSIGAQTVDIVGHSMGGLIGRIYLQEHEDKVNKIVTLGSPHKGSTNAYPALEGGLVWGGDSLPTLAKQAFVRYRKNRLESEAQTIQRLAPSLQDLMPTYNFLYDTVAGSFIDSSTLYFKNDTLLYYNPLLSPAQKTKLYPLSGTGEDTLETIDIIPRTSIANWVDENLNRWIDGEPIHDYGSPLLEYSPSRKDYSSAQHTTPDGDNIVLTQSADPDSANPSWQVMHGQLPQNLGIINQVFDILEYSGEAEETLARINFDEGIWIQLRSPATLLVTDPDGNQAGEGADPTKPIENAYYNADQKLVIIPNHLDGQYTLTITGEEKGKYGLFLITATDEGSQLKEYWFETETGQVDTYEFGVQDHQINPISPVPMAWETIKTGLVQLQTEAESNKHIKQASQLFQKAQQSKDICHDGYNHLRVSWRHLNRYVAKAARNSTETNFFDTYPALNDHYHIIMADLVEFCQPKSAKLKDKHFEIYEKKLMNHKPADNQALTYLYQLTAEAFLDAQEATNDTEAYTYLYQVKSILPYLK